MQRPKPSFGAAQAALLAALLLVGYVLPMSLFVALLSLHAATTPTVIEQVSQCQPLSLGSAHLTAGDLRSIYGPTLDLRIPLADTEARALRRDGTVQLGSRGYYAGRGYVQFPAGYFADPAETVAARPERPYIMLSFEPGALAELVAGQAIVFVDNEGQRIERQLDLVDAAPLQACLNQSADVPRRTRQTELRHTWAFVPLPPGHRLRLRSDAQNTSDHYPLDAMRAGRGGENAVRITVGTNGRVIACSLAISSGHADIDAASCAAVQRMIFLPQINETGEAEAVTVIQRFSWRPD